MRANNTLTGRRLGNTFRVGDLVRVSVARVDVDRRELDFTLIQRGRRPGKKLERPTYTQFKRGNRAPPKRGKKRR